MLFQVMYGRAAEVLFEYAGKIQRFVISAHACHFGDIVLVIERGQELFRSLHAYMRQVCMRSHAHLVFE